MEKLIEHLQHVIVEIDEQGRILWRNEKAARCPAISCLEYIQLLSPECSVERLIGQEGGCVQVSVPQGDFFICYHSVLFEGRARHLLVFYPQNCDQRLLALVLNRIDDIVVVTDEKGNFQFFNQMAKRYVKDIWGYDHKTLLGTSADDTFAQHVVEGRTIIAMATETKEKVQSSIRYIDGPVILYTAIPVFQEDILTHIILTGRDMSQLSKLQDELEQTRRINEFYIRQIQNPNEDPAELGIICSSRKMEDVLKVARQVAKTDSAVFITGESGTGKEEVAKYIHHCSKRAGARMISINCAAIPRELMESDFFGYEEGAFTGGRKGGRKGLLEEASGGTVFLDELGELPLPMQSKLLRVVQEEKVRPVGSNQDVPVDVRYICATNLTPEQLQDERVFRQDLFYRLSVIPLSIPPLRERPDDILPLIENFLTMYNKRYERQTALSQSAYERLCREQWPGNVRQLKNTVERIVVLGQNQLVTAGDLELILGIEPKTARVDYNSVQVSGLMPLREAQGQLEDQLIHMALEKYGSVSKAALALGVPPVTIYRKLKKT